MPRRQIVATVITLALAGSALLIAQEGSLPSMPKKQFGASVTGAFDGWFDNADGTRSFLLGYYSRNSKQIVDVPIGPNNRIEPGGPDMGQPTHFLPGRHVGVFTVTVPKDFAISQQLIWTLTVNGQTTAIPLRLKPDYYVSPFGGEQVGNIPPTVRFEDMGKPVIGPIANMSRVIRRTATVSTPLSLPIWVEDDARYSSGSGAPMRTPPPPVSVHWSKYRGTGVVTFANAEPALDTLKGGTPNHAYAGKGLTTASFSEPGEYLLHATVNDYSGPGGGGEVCCWTDALIGVTVTH